MGVVGSLKALADLAPKRTGNVSCFLDRGGKRLSAISTGIGALLALQGAVGLYRSTINTGSSVGESTTPDMAGDTSFPDLNALRERL